MSVEFELRRVSVAPVNIDEMLDAWFTTSQVQASSVRLPDGTVEVFVPGISIRGLVVLRRWGWFLDRIELRLSVCASHGDWRAAYSLVRFARERGFNVREDGNTIEDDSLTDEVASRRGREAFAHDVGFLLRLMASANDDVVYLPNARFSVPVTRRELPTNPLAGDALTVLQETLQRRAKKYASARSAAVITLKTGETAIVWTGDALLAPAVNHVLLPRGEFDPANCVYVPFSRAIQDLSEIVEEIQRTPSRYFFDAIGADNSRWRQLVDSGAPIDQLNRESD